MAEEWTSFEIEEFRSLILSFNNNNNTVDDGDGENTKHNIIVEYLHKWFPWKTIQEVTKLYTELVVEKIHTMQCQEKSGSDDMRVGVDSMNTIASSNFGAPEEEGFVLDDDDLLFDYPLEDMEIGMETPEVPMIEENHLEVEVEVETPEVPVVKENQLEELENQADHHLAMSQKGKIWTSEEQSQFLRGLHVFGRGKWKRISKHFVTTRTPVQISSHAQKYFKKLESNTTVKRRRHGGVIEETGSPLMLNAEFATKAFAFAGSNYDPCLNLPPNPFFLEDLARIWSPLLYRPQENQVWREQVIASTTTSMEGTGTGRCVADVIHGASHPEQWMASMF